MNILIAVHHFPPNFQGGAEWRACRTASFLLSAGHNVRVVSIESINNAAAGAGLIWHDDLFDGIPVRRLSFDLSQSPDPFLWQYKNPLIAAHLREEFRADRPDIFHLIGGYLMSGSALEAAYEARIPTVLSLTDFWFFCARISMLDFNGKISTLPIRADNCARCLAEQTRRYRWPGKIAPGLMRLYWRMEKNHVRMIEDRNAYLMRMLNSVDIAISPSEFLRSMYIEAGMDSSRVRFTRQGHDYLNVQPELLEKSPSPVLRLGHTGQIALHKGVHVLVEAVRKLPRAPLALKIYGDTSRHPQYMGRLRSLAGDDPRIQFAGVYPREDISRILQNLDAVVIPSIWYENSPNSILESFAHHTPVIASALGGMQELVQHGHNGLLFEAGNAEDLAAQISGLIENPTRLRQLSAGIEPMKSIRQEMDELMNIYREILCEPSL